MRRITAVMVFLGLFLGFVPACLMPAEAADRARPALEQAVDYLQQQDKTEVLQLWSYVALARVGEEVGTRADGACRERLPRLENGETTDYAALILAVLAAGGDPENYQGRNLLRELQKAQLPSGKFADNIRYGGEELVNAHIWAVLALTAAGAEIPNIERALSWLVTQQHEDGSYYWYAGDRETADVDSTGMALMAFGALGEKEDNPSVKKAVAYLSSVQEKNGVFLSWGTVSPEACSVVIQGLTAVGIDPTSARWQQPGGDPVSALLSFQRADGSFAHQKGGSADEIATWQALIALGDICSGENFYLRWKEKGGGVPADYSVWFQVGARSYTVKAGDRQEVVRTDAPTFIREGRTYVPLRYLAAALEVPDSGISWDEVTQEVVLEAGATRVQLTVGAKQLLLNGTAKATDAALLLENGRTFLPARYVAEAFGYDVDWDGAAQAVIIKR